MTIENQHDWWELTNRIWPDIIEIFYNCGSPMDSEWFSEGVGQEVTQHSEIFSVMLQRLKYEENGKELSRWFNLCWLAAPDEKYIHSWRNWGNFCDLCSENWVFYEGEENG